jgi:hypothetical protein
MRYALVMLRSAVAVMTVLVLVGCSRREDDRSIKPAPEQSAPAAPAVAAQPPPAAPIGATDPVANPLAMPLKHDGAHQAPGLAAADPCARPDPNGPLAMRLRHDGHNGPGRAPAPNPLCMRLK